jgi:hypothetical protein
LFVLSAGAAHAFFAGHLLYVSANAGLVVLDLDVPLEPKVLSVIPLRNPRGAVQQFRYVFVLDDEGLAVVDVTHPEKPRRVLGVAWPSRSPLGPRGTLRNIPTRT